MGGKKRRSILLELPVGLTPRPSDAEASAQAAASRTSRVNAADAIAATSLSTEDPTRTASTDSNRPLLSTPFDFANQWLHKVGDEPAATEAASSPEESFFERSAIKARSPTRYRPSISAVKKASKPGVILRRAASLTGPLPAIVTSSEPSHSLTQTSNIFQQLQAESQQPTWKVKALAWLDGTYISCFIICVTLLAVFLHDFQLAALPRSADAACTGITIFFLVVFVMDTTAATLVRPGYAFRFYW